MNRTRILYPETSVLVVSPADCDHLALARIFAHTSWQTSGAFSWNEARCWVEMHRTAVVITVHQMDGGQWVELAQKFAARPAAPELIVTADTADGSLWAEVFNRNAYDLLLRPFVADEVIRTVSGAWRRWHTRSGLALRKNQQLKENTI